MLAGKIILTLLATYTLLVNSQPLHTETAQNQYYSINSDESGDLIEIRTLEEVGNLKLPKIRHLNHAYKRILKAFHHHPEIKSNLKKTFKTLWKTYQNEKNREEEFTTENVLVRLA